METSLVVALIGVISVLSSALIQYHLGRHFERNKKSVEIRFQAYVDFVNAVADIATSAKSGKFRSPEQTKELTRTKTRVIMVGSRKAVHQLHRFFSTYKTLDSPEAQRAFGEFVSAMRADISGKDVVPCEVLSALLFEANPDVGSKQ